MNISILIEIKKKNKLMMIKFIHCRIQPKMRKTQSGKGRIP